MRWTTEANGYKLTVRHEDVLPKHRLVWRWYKCVPLVVLMLLAGVLLAALPWLYLTHILTH